MCAVKKCSREKQKLLLAGVLQKLMLAQAHSFSIVFLCVARCVCVAEERPKDIPHTASMALCGHGRERGRAAHMRAVGSASEKFLS